MDFELNGYNAYTFLWSDLTTDSLASFNTPGMYWVEIDSGVCTYSDTIIIDYVTVNLGNDTTFVSRS